MIRIIRKWKAQQKIKQYHKGYQYAAEVLLRDGSIGCIAKRLFINKILDNVKPFDAGVGAALKDYRALTFESNLLSK